MSDETKTDDSAEWKASLRKSIECYVPREMSRKVYLSAGKLRNTFGDAAAAKLGATKDLQAQHVVELTVQQIYEATQ